MAISSHLDSVVRNVENGVRSHLGVEGGVGDSELSRVAREERVEISLGLSIEGGLREGRLVGPHEVEEVEEMSGRDRRLADNSGGL